MAEAVEHALPGSRGRQPLARDHGVRTNTCVRAPRAQNRVKYGGAPIKPVLLGEIYVPEWGAAGSKTISRWGEGKAQVLLTYRLRAANGWAVVPA